VRADPRIRFVLLANHGLLSWGESSGACYDATLEATSRSASALEQFCEYPIGLGGAVIDNANEPEVEDILVKVLPAIRGSMTKFGKRVVLAVGKNDDHQSFVSSKRGPGWSLLGPACPDHVVNTRARPLVVGSSGDLVESCKQAIADYATWYAERYATLVDHSQPSPDGNSPSVCLLPAIGIVAAGSHADQARLCLDQFESTMRVIRACDRHGGYSSISEEQAFADEYWPLMRRGDEALLPRSAFANAVFLVIGSDRLSRLIAQTIAEEKGHVLWRFRKPDVSSADRCESLRFRRSPGALDGSAIRSAILAFGGVDYLIRVLPSDLGEIDAALMRDCQDLIDGFARMALDQGTPARAVFVVSGEVRRWRNKLGALEAPSGLCLEVISLDGTYIEDAYQSAEPTMIIQRIVACWLASPVAAGTASIISELSKWTHDV
jgi:hypothetical protein